MFGTTRTRDRKHGMTARATVRVERLEARNLTTGGLMGSLDLSTPPPAPVGLLLPAVQKIRQAAARMSC